jgi:hypothetical protein
MDSHKPCLRIAGDRAEAVRQALIAKLVPPVVIVCPFAVETSPETADMVETVSAHDSPDFAAEKILDALAGRGWIQLCEERLTPVEERAIRARLIDLGYIE